MKFITIGGVVINVERIEFINFRKEGEATVHAGGHTTFSFEGDDAAALLKRFPPAPPEPAVPVAVEKNGKKGKNDPPEE